MNDTGYVSEMTRNGVCGNESGNTLDTTQDHELAGK